jgi:hypothetical protein
VRQPSKKSKGEIPELAYLRLRGTQKRKIESPIRAFFTSEVNESSRLLEKSKIHRDLRVPRYNDELSCPLKAPFSTAC